MINAMLAAGWEAVERGERAHSRDLARTVENDL
jgi:hypothetical protein